MTDGTDALSAGGIEMIVPAGGCDSEQLLAYKNFIAVLSAILVKYATELDSEESV